MSTTCHHRTHRLKAIPAGAIHADQPTVIVYRCAHHDEAVTARDVSAETSGYLADNFKYRGRDCESCTEGSKENPRELTSKTEGPVSRQNCGKVKQSTKPVKRLSPGVAQPKCLYSNYYNTILEGHLDYKARQLELFQCSKFEELVLVTRDDLQKEVEILGKIEPSFNGRICSECTYHNRENPVTQRSTSDGVIDVKWSYAVTTVPQRLDTTLPKALESLSQGGFDEPRLFIDGPQSSNALGRYPTVFRGEQIRPIGNWVLALWELYLREPLVDRYAIFQDDILCCKNLRDYLDECPYPDKGYLNLYTFPHNAKQRVKGWHESDQHGKGALGLIFDRATLGVLLASKVLVMWPQNVNAPHGGYKSIDGCVVTALRKHGWTEYVHTPSLLQHTGDESTINASVHPKADTFPGEDFDALNLLPGSRLKLGKPLEKEHLDELQEPFEVLGIDRQRFSRYVRARVDPCDRKALLEEVEQRAQRVSKGKSTKEEFQRQLPEMLGRGTLRTVSQVVESLTKPDVAQLPTPPYQNQGSEGIFLAVENMSRHTADAAWQLTLGLQAEGYTLWGHGFESHSETDVVEILKRSNPGVVIVQDKREWDNNNPGRSSLAVRIDPKSAFTNVSALQSRNDIFKLTVLKDAQQQPPYHRQSAKEIGVHGWITYYHPNIVCRVAPYVRKQHLIRTYHSVDPTNVPAYTRRNRKGCLLSGAVSGAYPLRLRLKKSYPELPDVKYLPHPGYHDEGCVTPSFLEQLSHYKVAICTSSRYGYALRKIIEATASGCIVITDLPTDEVLPEIDSNLVRVGVDIDMGYLSVLLQELYESYDPDKQRELSKRATAFYGWREVASRLAKKIERLKENYE